MTVRREWETRPKLLEVASNAEFPAYKEAVKKRLVSHDFNREFYLKDDPRQQEVWTTWVKYGVSFLPYDELKTFSINEAFSFY